MLLLLLGSCGMVEDEAPMCIASFRDCDGDRRNGCEVDVSFSPSHCGTCGNACPPDLTCGAGTCRKPNDIVEVEAAGFATCARRASGEVDCWGSNQRGLLGIEAQTSPSPVRVPGIDDAVELAGGADFMCARRKSGRVACWGQNTVGQLGQGTTSSRDDPRDVVELEDVAQIAAGPSTACALRRDGRVLCWGHRFCGAVGDGISSLEPQLTPKLVEGLGQVVQLGPYCAVDRRGTISCWGDNTLGQHGNGATVACPDGIGITTVSTITNAKSVAANELVACAIRTTGGVACWGYNGVLEPRDVAGVSDVEEIGLSLYHFCARLRSGRVTCWGANEAAGIPEGRGLRGLGEDVEIDPATPTVVPDLEDVISITVGAFHACVVRMNGAVLCWGSNSRGQLGLGTSGPLDYRPTPTPVVGL